MYPSHYSAVKQSIFNRSDSFLHTKKAVFPSACDESIVAILNHSHAFSTPKHQPKREWAHVHTNSSSCATALWIPRYLWIPTDTYGVPACCAHLPCPLALSLLCWGSVPAPDRCWGFRAGLQSASVTWTAKPASGSELKLWLQTAQCLGAQSYVHTGDTNRQNLRLGTNGSPAGNGTLWFY